MTQTPKSFDCVEMKRRIQERIYEDTKGMDHREFAAYMRERVARSRFASFLKRPVGKHQFADAGTAGSATPD